MSATCGVEHFGVERLGRSSIDAACCRRFVLGYSRVDASDMVKDETSRAAADDVVSGQGSGACSFLQNSWLALLLDPSFLPLPLLAVHQIAAFLTSCAMRSRATTPRPLPASVSICSHALSAVWFQSEL